MDINTDTDIIVCDLMIKSASGHHHSDVRTYNASYLICFFAAMILGKEMNLNL